MPDSRTVEFETAGPEPPGVEPRSEPQRPAPIEIDPDASLGELVDVALRSCLEHLLANRAAARSMDDPEGVHQLRVAVRRTRSALGLFRKVLADERPARLRDELRWLGRALSPARDWDVFCLETLAGVRADCPEEPALRPFCWEAGLRRVEAHGIARTALDDARFADLVVALDRFVRGGAWRLDVPATASRRLDRSARKTAARLLDLRFGEVRLLDRPFPQLSPAELHALRIRVKRLRYATEFLAPLRPGRPARRFTRRLRELQDALGRINDGRVADELVEALLGRLEPDVRVRLERAAGIVSGWSHARAGLERRGIEKKWRRVAGATPFWR